MAADSAKPRLPLWVSNCIVFGLLFAAVVIYFLGQIRQTERAFIHEAEDHARMAAHVIEFTTAGADISLQVTENILKNFLASTARFVDYLESIEPFTHEELAAYAREANLAGIQIVKPDGAAVEGPADWDAAGPKPCQAGDGLRHLESGHLYLYTAARTYAKGCIIVGIDARTIESLREELGFDRVSQRLTKIPNISYVRMEPSSSSAAGLPEPSVRMLDDSAGQTIEVRLTARNGEIIVGMSAGQLKASVGSMWRNFFAFSAFLAILGGVLSFLLYRRQSMHVAQVRAYERHIAIEREDAALGRAAASIAHEIRNPLNAMGMGLQRLHMECDELQPEYRQMVTAMLDAVRSANTIVSGLLHFARPQQPRLGPVRLEELLERAASLYRHRCAELGINMKMNISPCPAAQADAGMLYQVAENLIRNAFEAQPDGGFISIDLGCRSGEIMLAVSNGGFTLKQDEAERIFEPYFTTKAGGTGLGLSIVRRIVQAHGGSTDVEADGNGAVKITICLPADEAGQDAVTTTEGVHRP